MQQTKEPRVNHQIRSSVVRLIDEAGKQLGILTLSEALKESEIRGYDLVEVAPGVHPPVCRIMDYGRYRYLQKKKEKEQLRHQRHVQLKEMKFGLKIKENDLAIKVGHVRRLLQAGHKTKITVYFRGREIVHPEFGYDVANKVVQRLSDVGHVDVPPKLEGKLITMVIAPSGREVAKPAVSGEPARAPNGGTPPAANS